MSTNGIDRPYIPPVNKSTDADRIDFATSEFLKRLQEDKRVADAHERNDEQNRRARGEDLSPADEPQRPRGPQPATARGPVPTAPQPGAMPPPRDLEGNTQAAAPQQPLVAMRTPAQAGLVARTGFGGDPGLVARDPLDRGRPLPTGAPQQPPSTGQARPMAAGTQGVPGLPPGAMPPSSINGQAGQTAGPQLSIVDTRTLALLASGGAGSATGRLVGPMTAPNPADPAGALVAPGRNGLGLTPRTAPPALSSTTPAPVRERIEKFMTTGLLDTAPLRYTPIDPLAPADPAGQRANARQSPMSPLARSVAQPAARTSTPMQPGAPAAAMMAPANDVVVVREPENPLAANDAPAALGLAMLGDLGRRGSAPPPSPAATPTLVHQTGHAARDATRAGTLAGAKGAAERGPDRTAERGPRALDFAATQDAEDAAAATDTGVPNPLFGVTGIGPRGR